MLWVIGVVLQMYCARCGKAAYLWQLLRTWDNHRALQWYESRTLLPKFWKPDIVLSCSPCTSAHHAQPDLVRMASDELTHVSTCRGDHKRSKRSSGHISATCQIAPVPFRVPRTTYQSFYPIAPASNSHRHPEPYFPGFNPRTGYQS
jgi:hypothetical protein